jgi:hypothetical protein
VNTLQGHRRPPPALWLLKKGRRQVNTRWTRTPPVQLHGWGAGPSGGSNVIDTRAEGVDATAEGSWLRGLCSGLVLLLGDLEHRHTPCPWHDDIEITMRTSEDERGVQASCREFPARTDVDGSSQSEGVVPLAVL